MEKYTDEEKNKLIAQFKFDKQNHVNLTNKYGPNKSRLIASWIRKNKSDWSKPIYKKVCEFCGSKFETENPAKKFCHDDCRNKAHYAKGPNRATHSITCFDCVNWDACKRQKNSCDDLILKIELTSEQLRARLKGRLAGKPIFFKRMVRSDENN